MVDKNNSSIFQTPKLVLSKFFPVMILTLTMVCAIQAKPADAFEQNNKLGRGVNIIGYDPIWMSKDEGRFKEKHFKIIKEGGFNTVRINLHPFRHMDKNAPYRLSSFWFEITDWSVENALKNGLMVIVDMHEYNSIGDDPEGNKERFLSFWRQIAQHFKDTPDNVIFEILNEPCRNLTPELWNQYYREALAIIRQSNPTRTVIIGPPFWNSVKHLNELKLPEDDRNIIVTVHYYLPMDFTHQGAPWADRKDKVGVKWLGTEEEKQAIVGDFETVQNWAKKHNRPIFLGEFGAYDKGEMDSRVRYTAFVARTAERLGFSWAYWQFDSDFIVYDVNREQWVEPIHNALIPQKQ
ncbi:MAG: glycoside hydrolase family 5 protein [Planctomycetota bacterium]|nr:glycoside hydrolase family 5 protein [Planctomycetota bacterium]